jgi:hypothetical protein
VEAEEDISDQARDKDVGSSVCRGRLPSYSGGEKTRDSGCCPLEKLRTVPGIWGSL